MRLIMRRPRSSSVPVIALLVVLAFAAGGCAQPRVDGTTDAAMQTSLARVRDALPEADRAEFDAAVRALALKDQTLQTLMADGSADAMKSQMRAALNGKTAAEILEAAKAIEAARGRSGIGR